MVVTMDNKSCNLDTHWNRDETSYPNKKASESILARKFHLSVISGVVEFPNERLFTTFRSSIAKRTSSKVLA